MDFNLDSLLNLPNVTVFSYSTELQFIILTTRREVPRYNCTQFSGGMKGWEIGGTEISKSC